MENEANTLVELNFVLEQCKFYPSHKRCVLAGSIMTTNFNKFQRKDSGERIEIQSGDRVLVYYSEENALQGIQHQQRLVSVQSLMKRWNALECGNDKCTGWIRLMVPISITCHFDDPLSPTRPFLKTSLQQRKGRGKNQKIPETRNNNNDSNSLNCWIWENCTHVIQRTFPESFDITFALEQAKFYSTKLMVLDGTVVECSLPDFLHTGERCWVHVRSSIKSLLDSLLQSPCGGVAYDDKKFSNVRKKYDSTGWMQWTHSINVKCRLFFPPTLASKDTEHFIHSRNTKTGAILLECADIVDVSFSLPDGQSSMNGILHRLGDRSFRTNDGEGHSFPVLQNRKERHHIFARWLVEKFGIERLSEGTGVLDVAGGKGEFCQALLDLGVRNATLLDPNPRCDVTAVKFNVIAKPLTGDGSDLKGNGDECIWKLVSHCSLIAGMHPDGATEAIVQTSLRLGVPFAILPCCFSQKLFPKRIEMDERDIQARQMKEMKDLVNPYQSYSIFCQHLLGMAPAGIQFEVENLPFQGRNKVIYFSNYICQIVAQ
jgi:hypothetical protein